MTVSRLCQFLVSVQLGLSIGIEKFDHGKIPVSVSKDFVSEKSLGFGKERFGLKKK